MRRYTLADAHCRFLHSLYAVAAAIRLFVARHSSPPSPFLIITFPPPCPSSPSTATHNVISNPMFLQQAPSESTEEAAACQSSDSSSCSDSSETRREEEAGREEEEEEEDKACQYFYSEMPPPPSPEKDFGWGFFNPFDGVRAEVIGGFSRSSDEDSKVVREEEGIPELEEDEERERGEQNAMMVAEDEKHEESGAEVVDVVSNANFNGGEQRGLIVIDTLERGRELLEALKDVEDHFIRAYDSGKDVSRILEANRVHLQSGLVEIKENSTKIIQAITWHRSTSSQSSSCKSFLASNSKGSSTWTEFKNDLFDDYGGMEPGSHSLRLGRYTLGERSCTKKLRISFSVDFKSS